MGTCDVDRLASVRRAYEREGFVFVELEPRFSDDGDGVLAARVVAQGKPCLTLHESGALETCKPN